MEFLYDNINLKDGKSTRLERALLFITNDQKSTFQELLETTKNCTMLLSRFKLRSIVTEVYKCIHKLNPEFLNELFHIKNNPYSLRDPYPLRTVTFKLKSSSLFIVLLLWIID